MEYDKMYQEANSLVDQILCEINELLKQYKYEIKYRVKSKEDIERKCKLKNYKDISNVEDIIGIRLLFLNDTYCKEVYHYI